MIYLGKTKRKCVFCYKISCIKYKIQTIEVEEKSIFKNPKWPLIIRLLLGKEVNPDYCYLIELEDIVVINQFIFSEGTIDGFYCRREFDFKSRKCSCMHCTMPIPFFVSKVGKYKKSKSSFKQKGYKKEYYNWMKREITLLK